jgi:hypothetical protein
LILIFFEWFESWVGGDKVGLTPLGEGGGKAKMVAGFEMGSDFFGSRSNWTGMGFSERVE